jgi:NADH-quinone oxidoreductase subunit L
MENNIFVEYILFISAPVTMVIASLIALNQTDIKRLLAYSTISNCAFIYLLILLKNYELAQFYFILHGVVKSFSFIIAGFLIQQQNHNQDIRN